MPTRSSIISGLGQYEVYIHKVNAEKQEAIVKSCQNGKTHNAKVNSKVETWKRIPLSN